MDKALIRQVEAMIAEEARAAFADQEAGDNAGWSGYLGSIWETLGSLTDYLARVAGALPSDRFYVRGKAAEITRLALTLQTQLMLPAAVCLAEFRIVETEPEPAADGSTVTWEYFSSCGLEPGHAGDHAQSRRRSTVIHGAEETARHAATLALAIGWMLADRSDEAGVREKIDGLRQDLDRLERDLASVPAVCWPS